MKRREMLRRSGIAAAVGLVPVAAVLDKDPTAFDSPLFKGSNAWLVVRRNTVDATDTPFSEPAAPYREPGSFTIYFREDRGVRCLYNVTPERVPDVLPRLLEDPSMPYTEILEGCPGAGYADEGEWIHYMPGGAPREAPKEDTPETLITEEFGEDYVG